MKKLVNATNTFGPFNTATVVANGYQCDNVTYQYTVVGECQIEDWVGPIPTPTENCSAANKQQAQALLQQTDWTCTVDITNPQYSNPYLTNQDAFLAYRSTVRAIAVNPPTTPAVFPTQPVATWSE